MSFKVGGRSIQFGLGISSAREKHGSRDKQENCGTAEKRHGQSLPVLTKVRTRRGPSITPGDQSGKISSQPTAFSRQPIAAGRR